MMDEPVMCNPEIALKNEEAPTTDEETRNNNDGDEIPERPEQAAQRYTRPR